MTRIVLFTSIALLAGALALPALAQDDAASAPDCPGWGQMIGQGTMQGGMMGGDMMQGMSGGMMGGGAMAADPGRFVEGRIAFLGAEVAPTDAQRSLFDAYAEALRVQSQSMRTMHEKMMADGYSATYPERLEHMEQAMSARADSLAALRVAVTPLYESLDEQQRQVFDQLMGMM